MFRSGEIQFRSGSRFGLQWNDFGRNPRITSNGRSGHDRWRSTAEFSIGSPGRFAEDFERSAMPTYSPMTKEERRYLAWRKSTPVMGWGRNQRNCRPVCSTVTQVSRYIPEVRRGTRPSDGERGRSPSRRFRGRRWRPGEDIRLSLHRRHRSIWHREGARMTMSEPMTNSAETPWKRANFRSSPAR